MNTNVNNQNYYDYMNNNYMGINDKLINSKNINMPNNIVNMPSMDTKDYYNYNNNNYNQPLYTKNENPNTLYDPYAGFIRGNMFPNLYNEYKITKPYEIEPLNEQAELLTNIDVLRFAAHDINLYLDVYPNDRDMINLFSHYITEANKSLVEYEKKFGPLVVSSSATNAFPWSWDNKPWPWENI